MNHKIILGARTSKMARMVAQHAKDLLESSYKGVEVEIRNFASMGDKNQGDLSKLGGKGAFVKDLEQRLLDGEIDCAIHALKDVPGDIAPHPDLELTCYLKREDPRDALIMRPGVAVPTTGEGLTLATSSPRRQAFLRRLYPQANIVPLRGNADTRMGKLLAGEFDGIVLAYSGLQRLDLHHHVTHIFSPEEMLPAVGQGILTLQVRKADIAKCSFLSSINSGDSSRAVAAERTLLQTLRGHCHSAIAAYCTESATERTLRAWVSNIQGTEVLETTLSQPLSAPPAALGEAAGQELLNRGARRLIDADKAA